MLEIMIQGRGGQGAQTAGNLLAEAFFAEGKHVQSFATYGGARRGTPVSSMIRVDDQPVRLRCDIEHPDAILCFDASLLDQRLLHGARPETLIVVNSAKSQNDYASLGKYQIFPIDGLAIARKNGLGRIVNSALLGAFCGVLGTPDVDTMSATILGAAPVKQKENMNACQDGFHQAMTSFFGNDRVRQVQAQ